MALYLVQYDGSLYANEELYCRAIAGGERNFKRLLASNELSGKAVLDQILFPVTENQRRIITRSHAPQFQDFDNTYKHLNVLSPETLAAAARTSTVIRIPSVMASKRYRFRHVDFYRLNDFNPAKGYKYNMLPQLATVRICKWWYIALDAMNISVKNPIIVTIGK